MARSTTACPVKAGFDPLDATFLADPYPSFAQLRAQQPVFFAPKLNMWVVTRGADIEQIFLDPDTFSAANAQAPTFPLADKAAQVLREGRFSVTPTMSNVDPPMHTRIRKLNLRALSPRRIAALEPKVQKTAERLVHEMLRNNRFDIVADLSFPLPAYMIFTLIGFPPEDTELLKSWSEKRIAFSWGCPPPDEQARIAENMVRYWNYCQDFVEKRLSDLRDDFTSDHLRVHLEDPELVSVDEIASIIYGLSFAGHETTTNLTTNTIRRLLENRSLWMKLCADPSLIKNAVEEALRYDSSLISWRRQTTREVMIGGVRVPAEAKLLLLIGSANRDPERFDNPEVYDINRGGAARHLSFGKGIHFCMGAPLARMEVSIVLQLLTRLAPDLELVPDQTLTFPANVSFRGPENLWLQQRVADRVDSDRN